MNEQRRLWDEFLASQTRGGSGREDAAWREFKGVHGFNPEHFARSPPWCEAGADNNKWAANAFLGDARREQAWAVAGYLDQPFHFAYLLLDLTGFSGLRGGPLPYTAQHTRAEMQSEARRLGRAIGKLNKELSKWPFRDALSLGKLIRPGDYALSVQLPSNSRFTKEQLHLGAQVMFAGARQELNLPLTGEASVLARAEDTLQRWVPPETLIERPRRKGVRPRLAARWLDRSLRQLGGDMPASARHILIAELIQVLAELGKWPDDTWTEEQVRRCLDGKSH